MDPHAALSLLALCAARGSARAQLRAALVAGARPVELCARPELTPRLRDWRQAERQACICRALGIEIVPLWELPVGLLAARPPVLLFVRGDAAVLRRRAVAVVGSRDASPGPTRWAIAMAGGAAAAGLLVVSGGARGIDAAAHRAAIDAGVATLAFLGTAADHVYPGSNRRLFERLLMTGGALASEHAPGIDVGAAGHAERNRFIAGLAERVYIAEAAADSGTLGTAKWAEHLGRPILVPPVEVGGQRAGLQALLGRGAAVIAC